MRSKIIAVPAALLVSLAMATGPALADGEEVEGVETEEVEESEGDKAECTEDEESEGEEDGEEGGVEAAAEKAAEAAEDLEDGDECVTGWDRAVQSFEATVERMMERAGEGEDPKGAGYLVLQALIAGESPSGIGAEYGKSMAEAAAAAREERETGKPEDAGRPENAGRPEDAGRPENAGRPDNADRPENARGGRPEGAGKP